jgi:amidophosphoribosyltransferase
MPSRKELVAFGRDENAIASAIGADLVVFQTLPDLVESVRQFNPTINNFDCSVFTGFYVTGGVNEEYLQHLESLRSDDGQVQVMEHANGFFQGKANGNYRHGTTIDQEVSTSTSAAKAMTDDTVGLHNSFKME